MVPDHVPDLQVLEGNQVVPPHKLGAQLVVEVRALVGNLGVLDSDEQSGMDSVLRALARPREAPLEAIQPPRLS